LNPDGGLRNSIDYGSYQHDTSSEADSVALPRPIYPSAADGLRPRPHDLPHRRAWRCRQCRVDQFPPPQKQPWGEFAIFKDPDGNQFAM
jgi:hypothetical protein